MKTLNLLLGKRRSYKFSNHKLNTVAKVGREQFQRLANKGLAINITIL